MAVDRTALQEQSQLLRQELKQWEKQFAAANGGRKAGREDIKNAADIAAKYKEYSRIRDVLSMKVGPPPMPESPERPSIKRKHRLSANEGTPLKRRRRDASTPRKSRESTDQDDKENTSAETPSSHATTPLQRAFVGPTPQKDGRVLGIFDLLNLPGDSPSPSKADDTPSRPRSALLPTSGNHTAVASTPKRFQKLLGMDADAIHANALATPMTESKRHVRTPQSSARRFLLDRFATPSKRKRQLDCSADDGDANAGVHDTDVQAEYAQHSSTPAFLRRNSSRVSALPPVQEDAEDGADPSIASQNLAASPSMSRGRVQRPFNRPISRPGFARSFTRSLSSLMADIRKAEDDRLDDELDALRDVEEEGGMAPSQRLSTATLVADSQPPADPTSGPHEQRLGPDGAHAYDSEDDGPAEDSTRRVYKKKGQKRQTRRVILKPAKKLPKPPHAAQPSTASAQQGRAPTKESTDASRSQEKSVYPYPSASDASDATSSEEEKEEVESPRGPKKRRTSPEGDAVFVGDAVSEDRALKSSWSASTTTAGTGATDKRGSMDVVRAATKRMSATAHANFRKLKIRGNGSSGKAAKGRWGRRR